MNYPKIAVPYDIESMVKFYMEVHGMNQDEAIRLAENNLKEFGEMIAAMPSDDILLIPGAVEIVDESEPLITGLMNLTGEPDLRSLIGMM